jgi:hypothetical protein
MNISPRNLKQTGNNNQRGKTNRLLAKTKAVTLVLILLAITFLLVTYRISLNEKVNRLERESILGKEKLKNLEFEIKNLQVKRAKLRRWKHIKAKMVQFKLDLQQPMPNQVVALKIIENKSEPTQNIASRKTQTPTVALR